MKSQGILFLIIILFIGTSWLTKVKWVASAAILYRHIVLPNNEARISKSNMEFQIVLKHYSAFSSHWIILKFLPQKLGI